ncbi:Sedlin [Clavulina sp. PMI_390]|nr:Sedlin [Clavulina sp. PMI_390]
MSHHLFLLSPTDTPLYSLTHLSTRPTASNPLALSSNLPSWSTSAFAGTVAALSGATSLSQNIGGGLGGTLGAKGGGQVVGGGQDRHVVQMIANASLDVVDETVRINNAMYLRAVDKFNEWTVSAFVTPGNMKFILLHDAKGDDGVKSFFMDVWELYIKAAMNPFHTAHTPIKSSIFDARVRASAKKYL